MTTTEELKGHIILDRPQCPSCGEDIDFRVWTQPNRYLKEYQKYVGSLDFMKKSVPYPLCIDCYSLHEDFCKKCCIPLSDVEYLQDSTVSKHHEENYEHCIDCWEIHKSRERIVKNSFRVDRKGCPLCNKSIGTPESTYELNAHKNTKNPWPMCKQCLNTWVKKCERCEMPITTSPVLSVGTAPTELWNSRCSWCPDRPKRKSQ